MVKLCDTSVLVDIDRGGAAVEDRVARLDDEGRHAISVVTVTELRHGVNKRGDSIDRSDAVRGLDRLLARFEILDVTRPVAVAAADTLASLEREGTPVHDLHDLYIGATAAVERVPVLTANVDHFDRFPDVDVIDWTTY